MCAPTGALTKRDHTAPAVSTRRQLRK